MWLRLFRVIFPLAITYLQVVGSENADHLPDYHYRKVDNDLYRTLCSVVAEKTVTKPGEQCFNDFDPHLKNIRSLCPTQCAFADVYEITHKVPSNHHICIKFENYGLIKRKKDVYLWRDGGCLNETIAFSIRCGFPLSRRNLMAIQKDSSSYLAKLLAL
ncbi:hypothetical protein RB195_000217 [Necator americanus]|uniref:DUF7808 domain-containing protein n=1 Tax=Necator americanus TaxID=51031 RepID=A0ABR1D8J4_NECAM